MLQHKWTACFHEPSSVGKRAAGKKKKVLSLLDMMRSKETEDVVADEKEKHTERRNVLFCVCVEERLKTQPDTHPVTHRRDKKLWLQWELYKCSHLLSIHSLLTSISFGPHASCSPARTAASLDSLLPWLSCSYNCFYALYRLLSTLNNSLTMHYGGNRLYFLLIQTLDPGSLRAKV